MNALYRSLTLTSAALCIMVLGVSCLKDKAFDDKIIGTDIETGAQFIEIMGPASGSYGQILNFSTGDTTIPMITLNFAADQPAPEDVKVTVAVDPAVLTLYKDRTGKTLKPLPQANYNFGSLEATIKKGTREAVVSGKVIDPSFLETDQFGLGLKIVSVSNPNYKISGNFGWQVVALRVKNKYHGSYQATGVFNHPTAGPRDIDEVKQVNTVTPNSVESPLGDLGGLNYLVLLTINPDNTVDVEAAGSAPEVTRRGGDADNYYDPATQTFHLHYSYEGGGGSRIVKETLVKL